MEIRSHHYGTVKELCVTPGEDTDANTPFVRLEVCTHPIVFEGLCAVCARNVNDEVPLDSDALPDGVPDAAGGGSGADGQGVAGGPESPTDSPLGAQRKRTAQGFTHVPIVHNKSGLQVSLDVAAEIERESLEALLQRRKLALVLDLDKTLLHATVDARAADIDADPPLVRYDHKVVTLCLLGGGSCLPWSGVGVRGVGGWEWERVTTAIPAFHAL